MSAPLFTPHRAEAAALRRWGAHDAKRLAIAITWNIYGLDDALAELAATLAGHAQRAGIRSVSCRELAASMLDDEITALDWRHHAVRQDMIEAVARHLANNPDNQIAAALAAADIARAANVPPEMIDAAFNIALWRAKRRA
jgi:ABC-type thiamine transport system ATPase subunit